MQRHQKPSYRHMPTHCGSRNRCTMARPTVLGDDNIITYQKRFLPNVALLGEPELILNRLNLSMSFSFNPDLSSAGSIADLEAKRRAFADRFDPICERLLSILCWASDSSIKHLEQLLGGAGQDWRSRTLFPRARNRPTLPYRPFFDDIINAPPGALLYKNIR